MSVRSQPGYDPIDLRTVIPVRNTADPMDGETEEWTPVGSASGMRVISRKLTEAGAFGAYGKNEKAKPYTLYADHRPGTPFILRDFDRVWHPDASERKPDGSPDYETSLVVSSVVTYDRERIAVIECSREAGR